MPLIMTPMDWSKRPMKSTPFFDIFYLSKVVRGIDAM
jgi:hypothetical protein